MQQTIAESILIKVGATNQKPRQDQSMITEGPTCRICLQQMKEMEIFNPCQCKGSNSYFHEGCLLEWVKKSKKHKDSKLSYYYICQICQGKIFLQTTMKYRCLRLEEAKEDLFEKHICCTLTTIIFLFCSFIVLAIVVYVSSSASTGAQIVVYSVGLVVTLVTIVVTILVYIYNYMIRRDVITVGIQKKPKQQKRSGSGTKVAPLQKNIHIPAINQQQANNMQLNTSLNGLLMNQTLVSVVY